MEVITKIIPRYAETDQMGIIHHSVYAVWYEQARTEYFTKVGMKYEGTLRSSDWNNQGICDACYYALLKSDR